MQSQFNPGDRVVVRIVQRDDIKEGDGGTVIKVKKGPMSLDGFYVDVILDSGIRLGHYHEGTFRKESEYDPNNPFSLHCSGRST